MKNHKRAPGRTPEETVGRVLEGKGTTVGITEGTYRGISDELKGISGGNLERTTGEISQRPPWETS